jgi:hypothetical protein
VQQVDAFSDEAEQKLAAPNLIVGISLLLWRVD